MPEDNLSLDEIASLVKQVPEWTKRQGNCYSGSFKQSAIVLIYPGHVQVSDLSTDLIIGDVGRGENERDKAMELFRYVRDQYDQTIGARQKAAVGRTRTALNVP